MIAMDPNAASENSATEPRKPTRVALNVLALCFALSVLGRGLGESFTVFLLPISENFGWDRAQVVSVYSLSALAGGLASPLIGRLFDRSGPRTVYSLGLILLGGAFLVAAHAQHLWQFQLSLGLCVGLGIAFIGNVPNSILLGRWFGPRLPTAMAVVYSATGAGVLILLPASQLLIDHFGWRGAYQIFGGASLLLLLPLLALPWRLFSTGSPHLARSAAAVYSCDLPSALTVNVGCAARAGNVPIKANTIGVKRIKTRMGIIPSHPLNPRGEDLFTQIAAPPRVDLAGRDFNSRAQAPGEAPLCR